MGSPIDKDELWKHAESIAYEFRSMDKELIRKTGEFTPTLLPIPWCLSCNALGGLIILPLPLSGEDLRERFPETVRNAVSQASEQPCQRCGGQLLSLGYIYNTLAWYIPRPPEGSIPEKPPSQHPGRQEAYITTLNTTVGRSLFITSKIHRENGRVTQIEEDRTEKPEASPFLVPLPNSSL